MVNLIINQVSHSIPEKWEDVSLKTFLKVADLKDIPEEEFKVLIILEAYTGISIDELKHMPLTKLHELSATMQFISTEIPETPIASFTISGDTYHCMKTLLQEEAQDFFATEAILNQYANNSVKAMPLLLAVICKKEGETLDQYDMHERAKLFEENLNVVQANSLRVFFYQLAVMYNANFQLYTQANQVATQLINDTRNTLNKSVGMGWRGKWLKKTSLVLLKLIESNWKTFYSGIQSASKNTTSNKK